MVAVLTDIAALRASGGEVRSAGGRPADVAIEIARDRDGSVVVFPALPAEA